MRRCALGEKDQDWSRIARQTGAAAAPRVAVLLRTDLPEAAPAVNELEHRLSDLTGNSRDADQGSRSYHATGAVLEPASVSDPNRHS
jgi:hypothetical protein